MKQWFRYLKSGTYYRPIIPVQLRYKAKRVEYVALVDSGADFNIFYADLAEVLEIDLKKAKKVPFGGIRSGALGTAFYVEMQLGINGIYFNTPVFFSYDISENGYGIVGQIGFFDQFTVQFDYAQKRIYLK